MLQWIHDHHDDLTALGPVATILAACVAASVTGVFAIVQAGIAGAQRDIAHEKLKSDLFEKRYERRVAVYEATRTFLRDVYEDKVSDATIKAYGVYVLDAKFLFHDDPSLSEYLAQIRDKVASWHNANMFVQFNSPSDERTAFVNIAAENLNWITRQGDNAAGFAVRFIPFLVYPISLKSSP